MANDEVILDDENGEDDILGGIFCYKREEKLNYKCRCVWIADERINPFLANVPILYPLKPPYTKGFLVISGDIRWEHWPEMVKPVFY